MTDSEIVKMQRQDKFCQKLLTEIQTGNGNPEIAIS